MLAKIHANRVNWIPGVGVGVGNSQIAEFVLQGRSRRDGSLDCKGVLIPKVG